MKKIIINTLIVLGIIFVIFFFIGVIQQIVENRVEKEVEHERGSAREVGKEAFVSECAKEASRSMCTCAYNALLDEYGYTQFIQMAIDFDNTGVMEQKYLNTAMTCVK